MSRIIRPTVLRSHRICSFTRIQSPIVPDMIKLQRRPIMERHEIIEMMRELKLSGMRAAYDDVMRAALQHKRSGAEILGDLLKAEIIEKTARSIRYQMSAAKFPVMKTLEEFDFDANPLNEDLVRNLHGGSFLKRNSVHTNATAGIPIMPVGPAIGKVLMGGIRCQFWDI